MHALLNLLDNAVKFSDAGTVVKVVLVEELERFVLRVVDQGPGIPNAERERIFGKFQRGSRTEKDEVVFDISPYRLIGAAITFPNGTRRSVRLENCRWNALTIAKGTNGISE